MTPDRLVSWVFAIALIITFAVLLAHGGTPPAVDAGPLPAMNGHVA